MAYLAADSRVDFGRSPPEEEKNSCVQACRCRHHSEEHGGGGRDVEALDLAAAGNQQADRGRPRQARRRRVVRRRSPAPDAPATCSHRARCRRAPPSPPARNRPTAVARWRCRCARDAPSAPLGAALGNARRRARQRQFRILGSSTPAAPKWAALRRIAPKLCGLPTPSSHRAAADPAGESSQADRDNSSAGMAAKQTPSWCALPLSFQVGVLDDGVAKPLLHAVGQHGLELRNARLDQPDLAERLRAFGEDRQAGVQAVKALLARRTASAAGSLADARRRSARARAGVHATDLAPRCVRAADSMRPPDPARARAAPPACGHAALRLSRGPRGPPIEESPPVACGRTSRAPSIAAMIGWSQCIGIRALRMGARLN